jgi:hypothetical protein
MARRFLLRSLNYGLLSSQFSLLLAAMMPRFTLDLRRHAMGK